MRHTTRLAGLLAVGAVALVAGAGQSTAGASTGTVTKTWSGTVSKSAPMGGEFYVPTGAGNVITSLTYTVSGKKSQMWWRMESGPGDTVVMGGPAAAPMTGSAVVQAGTYGWIVNCVCSANYTLTVTYPAP